MQRAKKLDVKNELNKRDFRVAIFGSARIKKGDKIYQDVFRFAKLIGKRGYDVVTGGGPGLMEAANSGHAMGDKLHRADSIGLAIKLPHEQTMNPYVELKERFIHFSDRLDEFMRLANVIVVTQGGIGTLLEFSFAWQLLQVGHIEYKPIILVGTMWKKFIDWVKKYDLDKDLVSKKDFDFIYMAKNNHEALTIIDKFHKIYLKEGKCRAL